MDVFINDCLKMMKCSLLFIDFAFRLKAVVISVGKASKVKHQNEMTYGKKVTDVEYPHSIFETNVCSRRQKERMVMMRKALVILLCTVFLMNMAACGSSAEVEKKSGDKETDVADQEGEKTCDETLVVTPVPTEEPIPEPTPEPTSKPLPNAWSYEVLIYDFLNNHPIIGVNRLDGWVEPESYNGTQRTEDNMSVFKLEPQELDDVDSLTITCKDNDAGDLADWEPNADSGTFNTLFDIKWDWKLEKTLETCWGNIDIYYLSNPVEESSYFSAHLKEREIGILKVSGEEVLFKCSYRKDYFSDDYLTDRGYMGKLEELIPLLLEEK